MRERTIYRSEEGRRRILQHYEKYIRAFPFDIERQYIDTSFGKTHVLITGPKNGRPLFIFQGGNCINPMTLSWFLPLCNTYRIYAPDTPGHPGYSDQNRIPTRDNSFAQWIKELLDHFGIEKCAFIGPSYGGGIILRLAAYMPQKIDCSVLVSPTGLGMGTKLHMITKILFPLMLFKATSAEKYLYQITNSMSADSMKTADALIIGDIFRFLRLEHEMPKAAVKEELIHYSAPTMLIAGEKDIFFPADRIRKAAKDVIPNVTVCRTMNIGHFPSEACLVEINKEVKAFLHAYYS